VLTALGDDIGIITPIAMLKSPLWFIYSNGNTKHSTDVTITTIYFAKLLLKIILSTFTTSDGACWLTHALAKGQKRKGTRSL
jgi:hypothetical protein